MAMEIDRNKHGKCVACENCVEFEFEDEEKFCRGCGHSKEFHVQIVNLGDCECGGCHGYDSKNASRYLPCDHCGCVAEKHFGWEKVQIELNRVKTLYDASQISKLDLSLRTNVFRRRSRQISSDDFGLRKKSLSLYVTSPVLINGREKLLFSLPNSRRGSLTHIPSGNIYLDELRDRIEMVKVELKGKFEKLHELLRQSEEEKIRDLDSIYDHFEKLFSDRNVDICKNEIPKKSSGNFESVLTKTKKSYENIDKPCENMNIEVPHLLLNWDELSFKESLQNICQIIEIKTPEKFFRTKPKWHRSKRGNGPQDLNQARGIAYDIDTQNLYIADCLNDRIQVYNEDGRYLDSFCQILLPRRICIVDQLLFVTSRLHQLNKVNKQTGDIIAKIELEISLSGIDSKGLKYIYVCDLMSFQVIVLRIANFKLKRKFTLKATGNSETQTRDIRVEATVIYVLFHKSQFPLQSFTQEGVLLRHIVTDTMVVEAKYFCLDASSKLLISDSGSHQIRVFSPQGDLVQVVGKKGKDNPGELFEPQGVAVNYVGDVFVVDRKVVYNLQAF